ncbi:MAG: flagellar hook protein FlgE, partial [Nevskiales bacterium]
FNTGALTDLRLSSADSPPAATSEVETLINLPGNATAPGVAFDVNDPDSFNHSTSLTVYDSLGAPHVANLYFVKTANPNEWETHAFIDGTAVGGANTLQYSDSGSLTSPANGQIALPAFTPGTGAADLNITLNLEESTQYGDRFGVNALRQDGFSTGRLSGVEITEEGVVQARFTNGQATPLGMIALANFANDQGLQPVGDTTWAESFASGPAIQGQAGSSSFGVIQSGALEASNVELTEELVNMIIAQRNFQANAQVISTNDAVTQTIINIR